MEAICWKEVKGYQRKYIVSPNGDVFSTVSGKILKPFIRSGYVQVELNANGRGKKHLVHRIVAEAYLPNENNLPCVNHKDGNKQNNNVDNLEWCSYSENMKHASESGLLKTKGENNPASKLSAEDVQYIREVYKKGDANYGLSALGRKYGVDHKTIWAVVNDKTWRN